MYYDLEHIKALTGTLMTLDNTDVIPDVFIQMDAATARKLASVLRNNKVKSENQELFFTRKPWCQAPTWSNERQIREISH